MRWNELGGGFVIYVYMYMYMYMYVSKGRRERAYGGEVCGEREREQV